MKKTQRRCGILLHPTSLPSSLGIGTLGDEAKRFVDLLASAHISLWQMLPLGPTGYGDSPYAARSTFAGNELLVDLKTLAYDGTWRSPMSSIRLLLIPIGTITA
jgi:4-alpha-glucanotransferase